MKKITLTNALKKLNKEWGLDHVSSDSGTCCGSCYFAELGSSVKTLLVNGYFTRGMNYRGRFEEETTHYISWDLPKDLTVEKVCEDLQRELGDTVEVIVPKDNYTTIQVIVKGDTENETL